MQIDVTGFTPKFKREIDLEDHSKLTKKFSIFFPEIERQKRGVFVIELKGQNLTSRALICKGSLTFI